MNIRNFTLQLACAFFFVHASEAYAGADADVSITPIALTANTAGIDITVKMIDRWVAQTEMTSAQLDTLGIRPGKLNELAIRQVYESDIERRARNFIEFTDRGVFRPNISQNVNAGPSWPALIKSEEFVSDVVFFGGLNAERERVLKSSMIAAAKEEPAGTEASTIAFKLLSDARQGAIRTSRGYRQLVDIVQRELEGRTLVKNIGMIIDIRTAAKQSALSPVSRVTMTCASNPNNTPSLVFSQRRRECNDHGVCRVESIAEVTNHPDHLAVYKELEQRGRTYLDGCQLKTSLMVDGQEVSRILPGKFTSHTMTGGQ